MSRVLLPDKPTGQPLSTVIFRDGVRVRGKSALFVRLSCDHERILRAHRVPASGRVPCPKCAALRTLRAYRLVKQMAELGLTEREVEYIAGRLAEQRDRQDGGK